MMELSQATIKKLNSSREGIELKTFIASLISSLDRVSDIPDDWDEKQKAIEMTARKRASTKLAEILKPLVDYVEPQDKAEKENY